MVEKLFYSYYDHSEHAEQFMTALAKRLGFAILRDVPQSLYDGWEFWVEGTPEQLAALKQALAEDKARNDAVNNKYWGDR